MSHDTDKLIRQLSMVAFLMAERRPLTARDVKSNVEGYSEMSDEAFARRFYSDRAELVGLGIPLHSQRDEFTGEELYTLRSEQYFLPPLELTDDELASLQTCLYLLEGKFAYAEPLRLALQNLALGRPGFEPPRPQTAVRVEVSDPDYSAELSTRLGKLEGAIARGRTIKFSYWSISRDETAERTLNPYALLPDNGVWYVVGHDLDRDGERTFRVSRIRGDIRFATRRERDFRIPPEFDVGSLGGRPPWKVGDPVGTATIEVGPETAWWVERLYGAHGTVEGSLFTTDYASVALLASWVLRQDGRARPLEPAQLRREVHEGLRRIADAHTGPPSTPAAERERPPTAGEPEHPTEVVPAERFAVLQALLAYLLARCGDGSEASIPAADIVERFRIPFEALEEHLSLLNLVNFGGGCYTVYAELQDDTVKIDKELYGDTFRAAPRLTPLEARAIRLALDFVGPMIAADARTSLERVRDKLEESFGEFELAQTPEARVGGEEEDLVATLTAGIRERRLVELEYMKEGQEAPSSRLVEPYALERRLPHWYVHTWDRTSGGERSFRLDRMRHAHLGDESFPERDGFEPQGLRDARSVRIWYSPEIARWRVERGDARALEDGAAIADAAVGGVDWLRGEIFSFRGEAVVLEPEDLRTHVAERAQALLEELERAGEPHAARR